MKKVKKVIFMLIVSLVLLSGCGKEDVPQTQPETQPQTGDSQFGNTGMPGSEAEGGYTQEANMEGLRDAVVEVLGESYWPNMAIPEDMLEEIYGIKADMYEDYLAECPMINVNVDTLIIVKAKEDRLEDVENALEEYREKSINESMQYPQNLGKIQASRIESFGNYVCFVQLGADTTAASDVSEEAVIDQCLEENERAIDAIEKALLK